MKDMQAAVMPLAAGIVLAALGALSVQAATLRPYVVVHDDTVHLKDIFDGTGRKGDTPLFRAPAPGQSVLLTGKWLRQVARTYELEWRPAPGLDESRLERSSNLVGRDRIAGALHEALKQRLGPAKRLEISLDNPDVAIHLPVQMPAEVTIRHLQYDKHSGRFSATLVAPDDRPGAAVLPVAGRVHELIEVPVLARRFRTGDIIRKDDVTMQPMRADIVDRNTLTATEHVIGKSARRSLIEGKTISSADVREPQMVSRGGIVVMTYRAANLVITAHGKVRENGTTGDIVQVQNLNSGKTVEAVVTGPDAVAVRAPSETTARCAKCR